MDKELRAQLVKFEARLETLTIIISDHYLKNQCRVDRFTNQCLPGEHKFMEAHNYNSHMLFCEKCGKWKA